MLLIRSLLRRLRGRIHDRKAAYSDYPSERSPATLIDKKLSRVNIDKNWLWGELNIQKGELCVKGILAQDLGFVWGPFQEGFGVFSG